MNYIGKSYSQIYEDILTTYKNQLPDANEILLKIKSSVLASLVWGLVKYGEWILKQASPFLCDSDILDYHGATYGLYRERNEIDSHFLQRILDRIQYPPAGGNERDYERWAMDASVNENGYRLKYIKCYGPERNNDIDAGCVHIVCVADEKHPDNNNSEIPDNDLIQTIKDYIEGRDPVGPHPMYLSIFPVKIEPKNINISVSGRNIDLEAIKNSIEAYIKTLTPGQILSKAMIEAIAIESGATDAIVTNMLTSYQPDRYTMVRPGDINVTLS